MAYSLEIPSPRMSGERVPKAGEGLSPEPTSYPHFNDLQLCSSAYMAPGKSIEITKSIVAANGCCLLRRNNAN